MKKRMFIVLCMVLIIALLSPNVFAATPAPEVPLADEATVTRVKNEIAAGEITDMEDVFLVAYQHLGADLEEEGMTAYINEDGTLGFTYVISSEKKMTRSGELEEKSIALTSLAILDNEANLLTDYEYYYNCCVLETAGSLNTVYVTHTMYINARIPAFYDVQLQLNYVATNLSHTSPSVLTAKLVQMYEGRRDQYTITDSQSRTLHNPGSAVYNFTPNSRTWFNPTSGSEGGGLYSYSEIELANTGKGFILMRSLLFNDNYINYDELFPD